MASLYPRRNSGKGGFDVRRRSLDTYTAHMYDAYMSEDMSHLEEFPEVMRFFRALEQCLNVQAGLDAVLNAAKTHTTDHASPTTEESPHPQPPQTEVP